MSILYRDGTIHSVSDPYATALLVEGGEIAWVGSDETADQLLAGRRGLDGVGTAAEPSGGAPVGDVEVVELDGALVVPAFVDSLRQRPHERTDTTAAQQGAFLSVVSGEEAGPSARTLWYRPVTETAGLQEARDQLDQAPEDASEPAPVGIDLDPARVQDLAAVTAAATEAGVQAFFHPRDDTELAGVLAAVEHAVEAVDAAAVRRVRHRLAWNGQLGAEATERIVGLSLSVTVSPDPQGRVRAPIASLLTQGVPVALGTGDGGSDLWAVIRACLDHPEADQRISARSGFAAATRSGLRVLPNAAVSRFGAAGRIAPAAPATFGIWQAESLSVQAPDGRVAAWSTDTRAGTPLLPVLEQGTSAPRWLATIVDGVDGTAVDRAPDRR